MPHFAMLAAVLAAQAPAAAAPPYGYVQEAAGTLRPEKTGVSMPAALAGLKRQRTKSGPPSLIALYAVPGDPNPEKHSVMVAIGPAQGVPSQDEMRRSVRGSVSSGAAAKPAAEGPFAWPGHAGASTFRGRYLGPDTAKEIWTTGDGRMGVLVIITTPAGDLAELDRLSAAVARDVFGGATIPARPPQARH